MHKVWEIFMCTWRALSCSTEPRGTTLALNVCQAKQFWILYMQRCNFKAQIFSFWNWWQNFHYLLQTLMLQETLRRNSSENQSFKGQQKLSNMVAMHAAGSQHTAIASTQQCKLQWELKINLVLWKIFMAPIIVLSYELSSSKIHCH